MLEDAYFINGYVDSYTGEITTKDCRSDCYLMLTDCSLTLHEDGDVSISGDVFSAIKGNEVRMMLDPRRRSSYFVDTAEFEKSTFNARELADRLDLDLSDASVTSREILQMVKGIDKNLNLNDAIDSFDDFDGLTL